MNSDFKELYESMCRPHHVWKMKSKTVENSDFSHHIAQLVNNGQFPIKQENENAASSTLAVPRTRILVPVSGGIASLASAWWALNYPHADVYFCHLVGLEKELFDRQMLCLTCLCLYARTADGMPVGAKTTASRQSNEHVRLSQQSHRMIVLPMPTVSFVIDEKHANCATERGNRHHPQTLALMYRQILNAAQSTQCSSIVWSFFDAEKQFIESLHALFVSVYKHQNIFPFENRNAAFAEFQKACIVSERVYSQTVMPVRFAESVAAAPKKKQKKNALPEQQTQETLQVLQTNGAAIMPDVAQFVVTCCQKNQPEQQQQQQQQQAQAESIESSGTNIETATEYLLRHGEEAKHRLPFNWCGKCQKCRPWIDAYAHYSAQNASVSSSNNTVNNFCLQYPLLHAYEQLIGSVAPKVVKKLPSSTIKPSAAKRKRSAIEEDDDDLDDDEPDVFVEVEEEADEDDNQVEKTKDNEEDEDDGIPIGPEDEEVGKPTEEDEEEDEENKAAHEEDEDDDENENAEDFDDDDDDEGLSSTEGDSHDDNSAGES